jgi:TolA-binding protein
MHWLAAMACGKTRGAAAALIMLAMPACLTIRQGEKLHAGMAGVRARLDDIDRWDEEHRRQVTALRGVLDQATALLAANDADIGAKEGKAEAEIGALQQRVDEMTRALQTDGQQDREELIRSEARVAALEQSEARLVDRISPTLPEDKEQLWRQAGERLASGQSEEGRRFFHAFIRRFPEDPRSPRAYLEVGRSFALERQFPRAAAEFQRVLDVYPRSAEVPEAMWQLSMAFVELRFCTDARTLLRDLAKRYPKSPPAIHAQKEMKAIKRLPRNACTS